ncbi:MAG: polysaccharide biosynthesis tyrosine autokinase [Burkholderiales bacterium]|nr:polysaccharide biosynthesis tyrosine autokinase [Burkholderiales bacterium]
MTLPQPDLESQPEQIQDENSELNLLDLLDVVLDNRWLVAVVTGFVIALGAGYAFLSNPIYEADSLIQVEDTKSGNVGGLLGDAASLFEIRSPATAEIEILRSRLVVGRAVQNLSLDLSVTPRYLPLVGRWLARRATGPSAPRFLGVRGYVSGNESLTVERFEVPPAQEGERFSVVLTAQGYDLLSPDDALLGKSKVGQPLEFALAGVPGHLLVTGVTGEPGATFYLVRSSLLQETEELQRRLNISEQGRQSGVIRASLEGDDPVRIARALNEIGALYVRQNIERKAAEAEKTLGFLSSVLPQLRTQLEDSEKNFNQFRNQRGTFDLGIEAKVVLDQAVALQTNLLTLQQKRQELTARFTALHPSVQAVDEQIRSINVEITAVNARVNTFPSVEQDLLRLTRDVKVNTDLYVSLLNSSQQLRLVKEGKVGNVRIVDVAAVPEVKVKPKRTLVLVAAAALGLLAGIAFAFVRNSLRHGIKDPADIELHLGLSVFATLPHAEAQLEFARNAKAKIPGMHVLAVAVPQDQAIESLRSLRTALQFAMLDSANNVVVITGPTPGVGKTFTSVNFAAVLGAADKKVLLIDADLRKGHLHEYFGLRRARGLSDVVSGSVKAEEALRRQAVPNVDFLSTGTMPPNPAEVLAAPATRSLLQQMISQYDLVIIDTPPVLVAADTAILASFAGAVFMVARADVTTLGELEESAKRLANSGVRARGVIFNDLNLSRRRYGYGAGYKYSRYRYTNYRY